MPLYEYQAKAPSGETVKGKITANTEELARVLLKRQGFRAIKLVEAKRKGRKKRLKGGKPKLMDIVVVARQLAAITKAGLPLTEGLSIITEQIENRKLKEALETILKDVQSGESFANALSKHPKIFDQFFVNMVRSGEASGMLDETLEQIAIYLEKLNNMIRKVKGALIYPAVVLTFAIGLIIFITVVVVPQFKKMFEDFGAELPIPTKITISISNFLINYGIYLLIILIGLIFVFLNFIKTKTGKKMFDKFLLSVPKLDDLMRKVAIAKFSRTLATLIRSGVNIINALEISEKTAGNTIYEEIIRDARISIQQGETIANTLTDNEYFPVMVVKMIDIGERTGSLESMLSKVAEFYEEEVDVAIATLTSLIEPLLIIFLGGAVGFIIVSIFLPMIKLVQTIA